ncbi:hypothetical protein FB45DRAFT_908300 [Roridomyces roridus]|uniref:Uncharacterized protein n=1 Tax=Roridomyces roridus TaxID=1738132 RepID=A0AAD7C2E7_9AGAR|nr:hypothetical protein FB45DRAFT_908300 [Roridomyces roridus]
MLLVSAATIGSSSRMNWVFWMHYYLVGASSIRDVHRQLVRFLSYLSTTATLHFPEISTVVSIGIMYSIMVAALVLLYIFQASAKNLGRAATSWYYFIRLWKIWFIMLGLSFMAGAIAHPLAFCCLHQAMPHRLFWDYISSKQSRRVLRHVVRGWMRGYLRWKMRQIRDFGPVTRTLRAACISCLQTWDILPLAQKFLIVAPLILLYGYVYIIPATRKLSRRLHYWARRRWSVLELRLGRSAI